jgi:hypothetical protein
MRVLSNIVMFTNAFYADDETGQSINGLKYKDIKSDSTYEQVAKVGEA